MTMFVICRKYEVNNKQVLPDFAGAILVPSLHRPGVKMSTTFFFPASWPAAARRHDIFLTSNTLPVVIFTVINFSTEVWPAQILYKVSPRGLRLALANTFHIQHRQFSTASSNSP
jgi:hypothetical protein